MMGRRKGRCARDGLGLHICLDGASLTSKKSRPRIPTIRSAKVVPCLLCLTGRPEQCATVDTAAVGIARIRAMDVLEHTNTISIDEHVTKTPTRRRDDGRRELSALQGEDTICTHSWHNAILDWHRDDWPPGDVPR